MGEEARKQCPKCGLTKSLSAFGINGNGRVRRSCLECGDSLRYSCSGCSRGLTRDRFTSYQRKKPEPVRMCKSCKPPVSGNPSPRRYDPRSTYECSECRRSFSADYYSIRKRGPHKTLVVLDICRRCARDTKWLTRNGYTDEEEQLKNDVVYDFRLGRTVFGYSYEEAVKWILKGYKGSGLTEQNLSEWKVEAESKAVWEPDPCKE